MKLQNILSTNHLNKILEQAICILLMLIKKFPTYKCTKNKNIVMHLKNHDFLLKNTSKISYKPALALFITATLEQSANSKLEFSIKNYFFSTNNYIQQVI